MTKRNSKLFKKVSAFVLAFGTLFTNVQLPTVNAEETNSTSNDTLLLDVHGTGNVYVTVNGETTTYTESEETYEIKGDVGTEVTIQATADENSDYHLFGFTTWTDTESTDVIADTFGEDTASTTVTIGTHRYVNVAFSQALEYETEPTTQVDTNVYNSLPSSGSGWLKAWASDVYGNTFSLQEIDGNLSSVAGAMGKGTCMDPGNLAWTSDNPYGVTALQYNYTVTQNGNSKHIVVQTTNVGLRNKVATSLSGFTGTNNGKIVGYQRIQFEFDIEPSNVNAYVSVVKKSSNPEITENNPCYSLQGAVYKVYKDSGCTQEVGTITTDASGNGTSNKMSIESSVTKLYAKEVTAPKGFEVDTTVYEVKLSKQTSGTYSGSYTGKFTSTENFGNDPLTISIEKVDANGYTVADAPSLEGAEFTVKYYAVDPNSYTDASSVASLTPTRSWVLETKKLANRYVVLLDDSYKMRGDELYKDEIGSSIIPLGVVTVEETKAPNGYTLDNKVTNQVTNGTVEQTNGVAYFAVKEGGTDSFQVVGGNQYTIADREIYGCLSITKQDSKLGTTPQGDATSLQASFSIKNVSGKASHLIDENGTVHEAANGEYFDYTITTDKNGNYTSPTEFLSYGTYEIKETVAPSGYTLGGSTTIQIREKNEVVYGYISNETIPYPVRLHKITNYNQNGTNWSSNEEGAKEFSLKVVMPCYLKKYMFFCKR